MKKNIYFLTFSSSQRSISSLGHFLFFFFPRTLSYRLTSLFFFYITSSPSDFQHDWGCTMLHIYSLTSISHPTIIISIWPSEKNIAEHKDLFSASFNVLSTRPLIALTLSPVSLNGDTTELSTYWCLADFTLTSVQHAFSSLYLFISWRVLPPWFL